MYYNTKNLKKLRDWVVENRKLIKLDMKQYAVDKTAAMNASPEHPCQTSCCLVGYGPSAGIPMTDYEVSLGDFPNYLDRVFSVSNDMGDIDFEFVFGERWSTDIDHAIKRLDYVIENNDYPDDWFYDYTWGKHSEKPVQQNQLTRRGAEGDTK